ncbi:MAG: ABC-2 family transporter protein, partial [Bdellovibrionales bacterium]|nr:ABC-2 family transporter protein [Bdellovibrionales bacterium]
FFALAVNNLHMAFFAMSFWEFSSDLRLGKLDFWLVKPAHILFTVFFRHIRIASLTLIPIPTLGLVWYGTKAGLSPMDWTLLPLLVVFSLMVLVSIEILISTLMFLTIESIGINFIRMQLQSVARWPDFIYGYTFKKIFTFGLPVLLVTSAPTHFLLDSGSPKLLLLMIAATAILWYLISYAWNAGLRRYESASS